MTPSEKVIVKNKARRSLFKRVVFAILKFLLFILILFGLALLSLNIYLQSNKTKIFSELEFLNGGTITFDSTHISVWKDFPAATISLSNVHLKDADFDRHEKVVARFGALKMASSLVKIWEYELEVNAINLSDGEINIMTDEYDFCNLKNLFPKDSSKKEKTDPFLNIITEDIQLVLSNIDFHFKNLLTENNIQTNIKHLETDLKLKEDKISAYTDFHLLMKQMSFKKDKGSFVANSHLSGKVNFEIIDGNIAFQPFELMVNEEQFIFSGNFDTSKSKRSTLMLENKQTRHDYISPLLLDPIQQGVKQYNIIHPFYSKTTITGFFKPDEQPKVYIDFVLKDNEVKVENKVFKTPQHFKKVNLKGRFTNHLDDNKTVLLAGMKKFRLQLKEVNTNYDDFNVKSEEIYIRSTEKKGAYLSTDIQVSGPPSGISNWLGNDKFFFKNGIFVLDIGVAGNMNNYEQIVLDSEANLELHNFKVIYRPSNTAFPLEALSLYKNSGDGDFKIRSTTLDTDNDFQLDGGLKNMIALLVEMEERTSSNVNFEAEKINWTDFVNLFGENGYLDSGITKTDQQKKKSMKETIKGIEYSFQPSVSVQVDTLQYYDQLELINFKTGVHFRNSNFTVLEETNFDIGDGHMTISALMDIGKIGQTPFSFELEADAIDLNEILPPLNYLNIALLKDFKRLPQNVHVDIRHKGILDDQNGLIPHTSRGKIVFKVNGEKPISGTITYAPAKLSDDEGQEDLELGEAIKTKVQLSGDPALFNELFETDQYIFDKGIFETEIAYQGDVTDLKSLIQNASVKLNIKDSEVYYRSADVTFPIDGLDLELEKDFAEFDISLNSDSTQEVSIRIKGDVENLSEAIIGNTGREIGTNVSLTSNKIRWKRFLEIFSPNDSTNIETAKNVKAFKTTLKGLLTTFNPDLFIYIDSFVYSNTLLLEELHTGIRLRDKRTVVLERSGFKFHNGNVKIRGTMDLSKNNSSPFSANFSTDRLDVAGFLKGLNYLDIPALRATERLSGQATMNFNLTAELADDTTGLIPSATNGELDFIFRDIIISGFEPLDKLADKVFMKKRLKSLKFAPIANKIKIKGSNIEIPLMEIQSNALNFFIEGTYSYGDDTNIWITIPITNIKSPDLSTIPDKNGYAAAKMKVYLEVVKDKKGENKFKLRLTKRKFYKQRGILDQYKIDRRNYRRERREMKKGSKE